MIKGVNKGGERRDAVMAQLKDKCRELNITYDEDVIRAMLETEWKRMKESEVLTHPLLEEIK